MGTKKFSELTTATTPLDYDEIIAIIQDSTSKKVAISEILANVNTIQLNTSPTPGAHSNVSGEFGGADPVNASQLMLNFDVHKQVNGFGSREEYE